MEFIIWNLISESLIVASFPPDHRGITHHFISTIFINGRSYIFFIVLIWTTRTLPSLSGYIATATPFSQVPGWLLSQINTSLIANLRPDSNHFVWRTNEGINSLYPLCQKRSDNHCSIFHCFFNIIPESQNSPAGADADERTIKKWFGVSVSWSSWWYFQ